MPASAPLAAPELHQLAAKGTADEVQFVQARMYALLPALHFQFGWLASAHHGNPHKEAGQFAMNPILTHPVLTCSLLDVMHKTGQNHDTLLLDIQHLQPDHVQ